MPIYNDERFAPEAIASLLAQTYANFELIISDNASTDGTSALCEAFARRDGRVRYLRQATNLGLTGNLNFVREQARGEFFMWAASDDRWEPGFIETLLAAMRSDSRYTTAFCPYAFMDEDGLRLGPIRRVNYSSRSRLRRLVELCRIYDDGCFYGLHRREAVSGAAIPRWRGINAGTPYNNAYPPLFYVLSRGDFAFVDGSPLWHNRLKRRSPHLNTMPEGTAHKYRAFVARKINVCEVSAQYVYRATGSRLLVTALLPALAARCVIDCAGRIVAFLARRALGINLSLETKLVEG
jgi:glycosyltransferase involved in cell wall biosynthesis